jgi:hypothetical protein
MANLHDTFISFDEIIKLSSVEKKRLRISRNAVRKDIEKYFDENIENHSVKFKGQGSFSMNTTILPNNGEYDVDDGVYVFGKEVDKPTPQTIHDWIYKAVDKRTKQKTIDKNACVRVQYAGDYHIDLPIYYKNTENRSDTYFDSIDIPQLAHKNKGWIHSDPYAFRKWFDNESSGKQQLKRIVRYLKAWSDNKDHLNLPSGMIFTILAANNFIEADSDDISLLSTLKKIQSKIDDTRFYTGRFECYRPTTDTTENLLDKYSAPSTKSGFLEALNSFINSGDQALACKSKKDACAKWQKHLGDRFPCSTIKEDENEVAKSFSKQDIIRTDNKSANV